MKTKKKEFYFYSFSVFGFLAFFAIAMMLVLTFALTFSA